MGCIKSLEEYMMWLENVKKKREIFSNFICYRGQENNEWNLTSSLQRSGKVVKENLLVKNLMILEPDEFNSNYDDCDILAKAQHFCMPTRLIDFTKNPYVALYFACKSTEIESKNKNGKVFACITELSDDARKVANEVCSYWRYDNINNFGNLPFCKDLKEAYGHYFSITHLNYNNLFFVPKYISDRERNQQAVFFACINRIKRKEKEIDNYYNSYVNVQHFNELLYEYKIDYDNLVSINTNSSGWYSIEIDKDFKEEILEQLNEFGINEAFIFPSLENRVKEIYKQI